MSIINPDTSGAPTGNVYIDALVWGGSWAPALGQGASLSWTTLTGFTVPPGDDQFTAGLATGTAWQPHELAALRLAFQLWSNVADLTFIELAPGAAGADMGAMVVDPATAAALNLTTSLGMHMPPGGPLPAPLVGFYNPAGRGWTVEGLAQGGYGFTTLLHEIGHGLGLAHPHDGGGRDDAQTFPGVTGPGSQGDGGLNQGIWTVMSYVDGWPAEFPGFAEIGYGYGATPMAFDIAAIQAIYGANWNFRVGDDVYALPSEPGPGTFFASIWDAGGTDEISAAGVARAVTIDLRAAPLSGANAGGYVSWAGGVPGGFTIADKVVIENATGGGGDDRLTGNEAANRLDGGAGRDTMAGGTGNDTYIADDRGDRVVEAFAAGTDLVVSRLDHRLAANVEHLLLDGAARNGTGNAADNRITGTGGDNALAGAGGRDTLDGQDGDDRLRGGEGRDQLSGGEGQDTLLGEAGDDAIEGDGGGDRLDGGEGRDVLDGGAGDDQLLGGAGNDTLAGGEGADRLTGGAGQDWFVFAVLDGEADRVLDFAPGEDLIVLDRDAFAGHGPAGPLAPGAYREGRFALDADDRVIYDQPRGVLIYDEDGRGGEAGVVFARLTAGTGLSADSFLIV